MDIPPPKRVINPFHVDPFTSEPNSLQPATGSLLLCNCS